MARYNIVRGYQQDYVNGVAVGEPRLRELVVPLGEEVAEGDVLRDFHCYTPYTAALDSQNRSFDQLPDCDGTSPVGRAKLVVGQHFELVAGVNPVNHAPYLSLPYQRLEVTRNKFIVLGLIPSSHFTDPDEGDEMTYTVEYYTGSAWITTLPAWVEYSGDSLVITAPETGDFLFRVVATDLGGLKVYGEVTMHVVEAQSTNRPPVLSSPYGVQSVTAGQQTTIAISGTTHFTDPDPNDTLRFGVEYYNGSAWTNVLPAWASLSSGNLALTPPAAQSYPFRVVAADLGGLTAFGELTIQAGQGTPQPKILSIIRQVGPSEARDRDLIWRIETQLTSGYPYELQERHKPSPYDSPGTDFSQWLGIGHQPNNDQLYLYFNGVPPTGQAVDFEFRIVNVDTGEVVASQPVLKFNYITPSGNDGPTTVYP